MLTSEFSAYAGRIEAIRRGQTRDALLSAIPFPSAALTAEIERASKAYGGGTNNLGRTWGAPECDSMAVNLVSGIRDALSGLSATDARKVASRIRDAMEQYAGAERSSSMQVDPAGTLATSGGTNPSAAATDASLRHLSADGREGVSRLKQMNAAAKSFWARQPRP